MAHFPQFATLLASATRTAAVANEAATAVADLAGAAGDVLDVFVDVEVSPGKWANAVHYTQVAGNGAAQTKVAVLDPSNPGTSELNVTSDAAAGAVRPALWGLSLRARHTLVDAGAHGQSATFGVTTILQ